MRVVYLPGALVGHVPDPAGRSATRYVRFVIRNDCLYSLYNEPWPMVALSLPLRFWRYRRMKAQAGAESGGVRWILGELRRELPDVWRNRRPVSWATVREVAPAREDSRAVCGRAAPDEAAAHDRPFLRRRAQPPAAGRDRPAGERTMERHRRRAHALSRRPSPRSRSRERRERCPSCGRCAAHLTRFPHVMFYGGLRRLLAEPWDLVHCWEEPYVHGVCGSRGTRESRCTPRVRDVPEPVEAVSASVQLVRAPCASAS